VEVGVLGAKTLWDVPQFATSRIKSTEYTQCIKQEEAKELWVNVSVRQILLAPYRDAVDQFY
jgi:hypothetical protein